MERGSLLGRSLDPLGPIYGSHVASQLLVLDGKRHIAGLDVRFATYGRVNAGLVTVRLYPEGAGEAAIGEASVRAAELVDNAVHRFRFEPPLRPGDGRSCDPCLLRVTLSSDADDPGRAVTVWTVPEDSSLDADRSPRGALRTAATYDGAELGVRLAVAPVFASPLPAELTVAASRALGGSTPVLVTLLVLAAVGLLLAFGLLEPARWSLGMRLLLVPAFGVAAVPLVVLYLTIAGLPLTSMTGWVIVVGAAAGGTGIVAWRARRGGRASMATAPLDAAVVGVVLFTLVGILMRIVALGENPIPPGGDAYHHTVITQLMLDAGSVPRSYEPYAPIASYAYHFGFHSLSAFTALLSGAPAPVATMATAVLLNGVIALSVLALARGSGLGAMGACAAGLAAALLGPLPAQLLDIARYPQSAALVILPALLAVAARAVGGLCVREGIAAAVLGAGLFLTHYRVALFAVVMAALCVGWVVVRSVVAMRHTQPDRGMTPAAPPGAARAAVRALSSLAPLVAMGGIALVLVSPWVMHLLGSFTLGIRGSEGRYGPAYYSLDRLGDGLMQPGYLLLALLGLAGLALGIRSGHPVPLLLTAWAALQLAFSNPHWLPLAGQVDTITVVTSLFIPLAVGLGYAVEHANSWWGRLAGHRWQPVTALLLMGAGAWGAAQAPRVVHPERALGDWRDVAAAQWIRASLPAHARFLVNGSIQRWEPDFVVPTDAGYWLPLLAGRRTTLLPMLYPGERGVTADQIDRMERIVVAASADPAAAETRALLREQGVTHVYLGVGGGPIAERALRSSPSFRPVYQRDGVAIYEFLESGHP